MMQIQISGVVGRKSSGTGDDGPYYSVRVDYIGGGHSIYFRGDDAKAKFEAFPEEGDQVVIVGKGNVATTGKNAGKLTIDNIRLVDDSKARVPRSA